MAHTGSETISIVIPCHNGGRTVATCLRSVIEAAAGTAAEIIVVDDGSTDDSRATISAFPCTLLSLPRRSGAAAARNIGARASRGDILFFTDCDCVLLPETLQRVRRHFSDGRTDALGGTYTMTAHDDSFFSHFQAAFIHDAETKNHGRPDYLATHALAVRRHVFFKNRGFPEESPLPILEDVAFSHGLKKAGVKLIVDPLLQVGHLFGFTLAGSWRNAFRKSSCWTRYSIANRDLLADSGTASRELKLNGLCWVLAAVLAAVALAGSHTAAPAGLLFVQCCNLLASRRLLRCFLRARGPGFALLATLYFMLLYPIPVLAGGLHGAARHLARKAPARRAGRGIPAGATAGSDAPC